MQLDVCTYGECILLCGGGDAELIEDVFWRAGSEGKCESIVGFVQVFLDKTVTTLKGTRLIEWFVHDVLPNSS